MAGIAIDLRDEKDVHHDHPDHPDHHDDHDENSEMLPKIAQKHKLDYGRELVKASELSNLRKSETELAHVKKPVSAFYARQNSVIEGLLELERGAAKEGDGDAEEKDVKAQIAIKLSFLVNVLLTVAKIFAVVLTGSVAVIASAIDSLLDLFSGSILFFTNRAIQRTDPYKFPSGKSRLEPVGVIVFASVMGMASLQILIQAIQRLVDGFTGTPEEVNLGTIAIVVLCAVVGSKLCLFLFCRSVAAAGHYPAVEALAQDHRNDVVTNTIGTVCAFLAGTYHSAWVLDPIGAIILAAVILFTWVRTGREQVAFMVGRSASPEFIGRVAYLAAHHHPKVLRVDTVRAYHFGIRYLCEVDIVLPEDLPLRETHDIGESLEQKIEQLDEVERAYVHLDYEWDHKPERPAGGGNRVHDR